MLQSSIPWLWIPALAAPDFVRPRPTEMTAGTSLQKYANENRARPAGKHELTEFIATYGIWLVAGFIALESVGLPFPAEAALMAAAIYAAHTHGFDIWLLIVAGILAALVGNAVGFWIGRRFGFQLLARHGKRVGLSAGRIRIGQWLFLCYGGRFVFVARFLPFVRNLAALLAGVNRMPAHKFYLASGTAAVAWVIGISLASYAFGEAFERLAAPAAVVLGCAAILILAALWLLILRYEKRLLAKSEEGLSRAPLA